MQQFLADESDGLIHIIIDHRESEEFDIIFKKLGAKVDRRSLSIGDFICSSNLAIERKTRSDFEQSIIDGRLFTQIPHLLENYSRVVVIVEGISNDSRISRNALLGAYAALISDYGVSLMFTRDIESTAELVFNFAKHDQLAKKTPIRIYAKRKALTHSQSVRAIVETLPTIGPKLAKQLLLHFGTLEALTSATENDLLSVHGLGKKRAKLIRKTLTHTYQDDEDSFQQ